MRDKFYIWEIGHEYPLKKVRVRTVNVKNEDYNCVLLIGDLKNEYKIMVKNMEELRLWKIKLPMVSDDE